MGAGPAPTHEGVREALSARLDGEEPGVDGPTLDAHLAGCGACRRFEAVAADQRRRLRVSVAPTVPDLTGAILASLGDGPAPGAGPGRARLRLAGAAVLLAGLFLAGVTLGVHLGRDDHHRGAATTASPAPPPDPSYPGATVLPAARWVPAPTVALREPAGPRYDLARATPGHITLLTFGPAGSGGCPRTVATAARAIAGLGPVQRSRLTVVLVVADRSGRLPAAIARCRATFAAADPGRFVGLTATPTTLRRAETQAGLAVTVGRHRPGTPDGTTPAADVTVVFGRDGRAHLEVGGGVTQAALTTTLSDLMARSWRAG